MLRICRSRVETESEELGIGIGMESLVLVWSMSWYGVCILYWCQPLNEFFLFQVNYASTDSKHSRINKAESEELVIGMESGVWSMDSGVWSMEYEVWESVICI